MKHIFSKLNLCWILFTTALLTIITLLMQGGVINFYYQSTLYTIGINMILAISLNLIIGVTGQFSLGHAGFMCIGAYAAAIITKATPNLGGFALAVVIGGVISALVALVVAIPTLRLKGDYLAIATLGFSEIVRIIVLNMTITNGAAGLFGIPKLTTWPLLLFCLIVSLLIVLNFSRSAPGRACISIREDEIASEAMGINTTKYKTIAFVIGAVLASLAGALYACNFYVVKPDLFTFNKSVDILILVVFGGMGSFTGSIVLNNQCIHSGLKMHLSTTLDNRIPHILNDTREFVCPNVRMGIGQYSRRSSVLTEYIQYLVYISSFLATGVKFSIRIGSCASFAKTIVRFRIYGMFSADLCQIFFPFAHIFSSFYDNRT